MSTEPKPLGDALDRVKGLIESRDVEEQVSLDAGSFDEDAVRAMTGDTLGLEGMRADEWPKRCPARFASAVLADAPAEVASELAAWATTNGPRPNLLLTGPVGTGKTHLALASVRADFVVHGFDVLFAPVTELLDRLRPGGPVDALDEYLYADRLVLDDMGAERPTDWTAERLYLVVNRRWMEQRPIVATTNLDPAELRQALGERTYSRLVGSDALVLRLGGDDRRRQR